MSCFLVQTHVELLRSKINIRLEKKLKTTIIAAVISKIFRRLSDSMVKYLLMIAVLFLVKID